MVLPDNADQKVYAPYLVELKNLFNDMDAAYEEAANECGFHCNGCEDNCCRSSFHHHTLLEYLYLSKGLTALPSGPRNRILAQARHVLTRDKGKRPMCPLNVDGRCLLYPFRPMICRLHGIPYTLVGANRTVQQGSGCHVFECRSENQGSGRLDRTHIYRRMALLERSLRHQISFKMRIHLTVAQMIIRCQSDTMSSKAAMPSVSNME